MARPEFFPEVEALPHQRSHLVFRMLMIGVTLVFVGGLVLLSWADYRRTATREVQQLEHFAELYRQSLEASLNVANLMMWDVIEDISDAPFNSSADIDALHGSRLRQALAEIRQVDSLLIVDVTGVVLWSSIEGLVGQNLSDRKYFVTAMGLARREFTIGMPVTSRGTGRRVTPLAWPVISSSGARHGVIAAALGEHYFEGLLSLQNFSEDMHVRVLAANGETAFSTDVGPDFSDSEGLLTTRLPIKSLGLEVEVSRPRAAVMRGYWERTVAFGTIASLLFLTVLLSAIRARRQSIKLAIALRRAEQDRLQITTTQREFDAVFENVGDGIVVFDDVGTLQRSNLAARRFLRVADDQAAVRRLREWLPSLSQIPKETTSYPLNLPDSSEPTGQIVQCRVMKMQLYGTEMAYCVLEDISAEERLSAARMSFITSVNHELRTPLTSLAGALDLLRARFDAQLPDSAMKLINMAARNADRLLALVNDILTLQAIDQKQLSIQGEPIKANEALEEALATNSGYGVGRGVSLVAEPLAPSDDATLFLDRVRLQQIFANLISNAVKYSPAGGEVRIGARSTPSSVTFYVSDKGPGIPEDAIDRLFDRFTKPIHSRETQVSGSGLGLAITRELVHRQGGEISVSSRAKADGAQNTGTTFEITFQRHTSTGDEKG